MAAAADTFIAASRILDKPDIIGEFMLNALRLNAGFSLELFALRTCLDAQALEPQLSRFLEQGLMESNDRVVRATVLGRRFLDSIVAQFFPD